MSKEHKGKFYSSVAEAFQEGKKDPYSGLRVRLKPDVARLWLESLRRQAREGIPNRYAPAPNSKKG